MMEVAKCRINGSDYTSVFCCASDNLVFVPSSIREKEKELIASTLKAKIVSLMVAESDLVGLFMKANSSGVILSSMASDKDVAHIKSLGHGLNVAILDSNLNAVGCNILANDKLAIVHEDYSKEAEKIIGDTLGVEVIKSKIDGLKTVGANNILTNSGFVINNRSTDEEKEHWDRITGFKSIRTTADRGALSIGLVVLANSKGIIAGESTTGFELNRVVEALEK